MIRRARGWRTRIEALPRKDRSIRLAKIWVASLVLAPLALVRATALLPLQVAGVLAFVVLVWVSNDSDFARLVVALTGGNLGGPRWLRLLIIPRIMAIGLAVSLAAIFLRIFLR